MTEKKEGGRMKGEGGTNRNRNEDRKEEGGKEEGKRKEGRGLDAYIRDAERPAVVNGDNNTVL